MILVLLFQVTGTYMNSTQLPIRSSKNRNPSKRQRVAKRTKISALQLEFVHPRTDESSEICTAPPVSIPFVANPPTPASGVLPPKNLRSRTQVLAKLVTSLTTIKERDKTILRLSKRLSSTNEQLRFQRIQLNRGNIKRLAFNGVSRNCTASFLLNNR